MKIQIERNLSSGSGKLFRCIVCEVACQSDRLRTLLCLDNGTIVGDICMDCVQQNNSYIQRQLHQRARKLLARATDNQEQRPSPQKQALLLAELTHQPLISPPFYVWWWKRLTARGMATQELEQVHTKVTNSQFRRTRSIEPNCSNE